MEKAVLRVIRVKSFLLSVSVPQIEELVAANATTLQYFHQFHVINLLEGFDGVNKSQEKRLALVDVIYFMVLIPAIAALLGIKCF